MSKGLLGSIHPWSVTSEEIKGDSKDRIGTNSTIKGRKKVYIRRGKSILQEQDHCKQKLPLLGKQRMNRSQIASPVSTAHALEHHHPKNCRFCTVLQARILQLDLANKVHKTAQIPGQIFQSQIHNLTLFRRVWFLGTTQQGLFIWAEKFIRNPGFPFRFHYTWPQWSKNVCKKLFYLISSVKAFLQSRCPDKSQFRTS